MPDVVQPDRLLRDELQAFQRRALRDWKDNVWLAANRPTASLALDTRDDDAVWLDLGGGGAMDDLTPGAVVVGPFNEAGEGTRKPDIYWQLDRGIPAEARTVDRLIWPVDRTDTALTDKLAAEAARVLAAGGALVLRGADARVAALRSRLEREGWTVDEEREYLGDRRIHQSQLTLRPAVGSVPLADAGPPNIREVVLGETIPERTRQPI